MQKNIGLAYFKQYEEGCKPSNNGSLRIF